jgi:hypothetical protein
MLRSLALSLCLCTSVALAQDTTATARSPGTLSVYLDCQTFGCDFDYFRTELSAVNWVRDRQVADLHMLVTSQQTGAGGSQFTVNFIGLRQFAGLADTLTWNSPPASTSDDTRKGLLGLFRLGMVRYLARTPAGARITVTFAADTGKAAQTTPKKDPWRAWVFGIGVSTNASGEETYRDRRIGTDFSASRVTEKWKTNFNVFQNNFRSDFELDDTTTFVNKRESQSVNLTQVMALTQHWSAGFRGSLSSSTYDNVKRGIRVAPALEFNIFPYSQSTRRQILLEYNAGYASFAYHDTTINLRLRESMPYHRLALAVETREPWGSITVGSTYTGYFLDRIGDFSDYRVSTFAEPSLRLVKGLELFGFGYYDIIHDQFGLALKDFTDEEKLTRQFQLGTTFSYFFHVGLRYTFGSIYNNVVNPRMGRGCC